MEDKLVKAIYCVHYALKIVMLKNTLIKSLKNLGEMVIPPL